MLNILPHLKNATKLEMT